MAFPPNQKSCERRSCLPAAAKRPFCASSVERTTKEAPSMDPITFTGLSTTVLDFTNTLAPVLIGLAGLVSISAGAILYSAVRAHRAPQTAVAPLPAPTAA